MDRTDADSRNGGPPSLATHPWGKHLGSRAEIRFLRGPQRRGSELARVLRMSTVLFFRLETSP